MLERAREDARSGIPPMMNIIEEAIMNAIEAIRGLTLLTMSTTLLTGIEGRYRKTSSRTSGPPRASR